MNGNDQIRDSVIKVLQRIAPEADLATLDPQVEFRDQLDIDSYDVLTFVIGPHEALDVDIPEADYQDVAYLTAAHGGRTAKVGRGAAQTVTIVEP